MMLVSYDKLYEKAVDILFDTKDWSKPECLVAATVIQAIETREMRISK